MKTSNYPLQQFINRYYECNTRCYSETTETPAKLFNILEIENSCNDITFYKNLNLSDFCFSITEPNCFAYLKSGKAIKFLKFFEKNDNLFFECIVFHELKPYFNTPCDSLKLNIGLVNNVVTQSTHGINDIFCKAIKIGELFIPLLHNNMV